MLLRQIARRPAHAASDVEDRAALFQLGALKQELDQSGLGAVFGVVGVEKVAVVEMLAP